jgi:mannose-6-phosphate isomerase-like protein (cupin superfamily)
MMLSKQEIKDAKDNNKIIFLKDAIKDTPVWETFYNVFKESLKDNKAGMYFPGTLTVDNSEKYTRSFDNLINLLDNVHPGEKIAALSIVHFVNAHNNLIPEAAEAFYKHFASANQDNITPDFDLSLLKPEIHSDPVDGFYIQCEGQTIWRAFYKDWEQEYFVNPGDLLYIPKGVSHSVESMTVRASISISFFDKEQSWI